MNITALFSFELDRYEKHLLNFVIHSFLKELEISNATNLIVCSKSMCAPIWVLHAALRVILPSKHCELILPEPKFAVIVTIYRWRFIGDDLFNYSRTVSCMPICCERIRCNRKSQTPTHDILGNHISPLEITNPPHNTHIAILANNLTVTLSI